MGVKRKQHGAQFKRKSPWQRCQGKTLAELAAEYRVHPTMISTWKQELMKRAGSCSGGCKTAADPQKTLTSYTQKIRAVRVEQVSAWDSPPLPTAERRAMIKPNAGLSLQQQSQLPVSRAATSIPAAAGPGAREADLPNSWIGSSRAPGL